MGSDFRSGEKTVEEATQSPPRPSERLVETEHRARPAGINPRRPQHPRETKHRKTPVSNRGSQPVNELAPERQVRGRAHPLGWREAAAPPREAVGQPIPAV